MKKPFILFADLKYPNKTKTDNQIYYYSYTRSAQDKTAYVHYESYDILINALKKILRETGSQTAVNALESVGEL